LVLKPYRFSPCPPITIIHQGGISFHSSPQLAQQPLRDQKQQQQQQFPLTQQFFTPSNKRPRPVVIQ
jgi:hypothetical protein